ncbi:MAG: HAD-IA family hydrolase [Pseudomonadota bacterium]
MKLGILQVDHVRDPLREEHGDYDVMFMGLFAGQRLDLRIYNALEGELPDSMQECDGYLITGSRFSTYDQEPWIERLKLWVVHAHQARCKLIGICFGHQLIADALGGQVGPATSGWRVGVHENQFVGAPAQQRVVALQDVTGSSPAPFNLLFSHQDQVLEMPPGATLLATGDDCPCAMYTVGDHILCLQGHPEMNSRYVSDLLQMRRPVIGDALADRGLTSLDMPTHQRRVAEWIVSFLGVPPVDVHAEVLLFDLDGTLVDREATMGAFLRKQWDEVPSLSTVCMDREAFVTAVLTYQEGGYAAKAQAYEQALASLMLDGATEDQSDVRADLVTELVTHLDAYYGDPAILFPGVTAMLELLSQQFRLALITNGNVACQQRKLDATGLGQFFEVVAISETIGAKKPSPVIFQHCFDALGVDPTAVVMIGDNPANDITGSRELGCMTVFVEGTHGDVGLLQTDQIITDVPELPVALRRMGLLP